MMRNLFFGLTFSIFVEGIHYFVARQAENRTKKKNKKKKSCSYLIVQEKIKISGNENEIKDGKISFCGEICEVDSIKLAVLLEAEKLKLPFGEENFPKIKCLRCRKGERRKNPPSKVSRKL